LRTLVEEHRYLALLREIWSWKQSGTVSLIPRVAQRDVAQQ
jgi:hypothetical protein